MFSGITSEHSGLLRLKLYLDHRAGKDGLFSNGRALVMSNASLLCLCIFLLQVV